MATKTKVLMRLYIQDEDGTIWDKKEDVSVDETCGVIPSAGDRIVSRWLKGDRLSRDYSNRTILDVVSRYFVPERSGEDHEFSYVVLVVNERQAQEDEAELF